jgi:hypothetical protein
MLPSDSLFLQLREEDGYFGAKGHLGLLHGETLFCSAPGLFPAMKMTLPGEITACKDFFKGQAKNLLRPKYP